MSSITFTDNRTVVPASWLNDVNTAVYTTLPSITGFFSNGNIVLGATKTISGGGNISNTSGGITIIGNSSITGTLSSGQITANLTGNVTGNASSATILQTARTINGTSFDGSTNITVTADASTLTNTTLASGVVNSSLTSVGKLVTGTTFAAGTGTGAPVLIGKLSVNTTAVGTPANTSENDLQTFSLPANSLSAAGKGVRITCTGRYTGTAGTPTYILRLYFGAQIQQISISAGAVPKSFKFVAEVFSTGSNAQYAVSQATTESQNVALIIPLALTQTDSGAIVIKSTGQSANGATNDIISQLLLVEMIS